MKPKIEKVLEHFPEFEDEKLKIGHTNKRRNVAHYPMEASQNDRNYIRLSKGVNLQTISHELVHVLTREKAIDILSLARSAQLIDQPPPYLDLPEEIRENLGAYRTDLHELAATAEDRFHRHREMVHWFEETAAELVESRDS